MAKETLFEVSNEKGTTIRDLEGDAKVSYKYEDSEDFEEVLNEPIEKGKVKAEDGKFPDKDESREFKESKIEILPTNYPFYLSRVSTIHGDPESFMKKGKVSVEGGPKKSYAERKSFGEANRITKLAELVARHGSGE